ncbi:MAG: pyridoxamine 5'-phosphate oxidase family protein [Deltaproteobacteria bacterium]|nr:pyridoxamine 5'-phosphate oxidase family protein [Deltaproteobacteria bacterium]MBW2421398.1 pyridoxamine 5'-phosphate oxidase family protein [Deltaproteobacteria bacterium]
MPREHSTIGMSSEELGRFAGTERRCVVGTLDADGGPWGDAVACAFHEGRLYFRVPAATRTLRNIQRDARVCCTIESHPEGSEYYTIKAAMFHGRAQPADAAAARGAGALGELSDPVTGARAEEGSIFSVGVDDVVSFDFAKIKRRFEQ